MVPITVKRRPSFSTASVLRLHTLANVAVVALAVIGVDRGTASILLAFGVQVALTSSGAPPLVTLTLDGLRGSQVSVRESTKVRLTAAELKRLVACTEGVGMCAFVLFLTRQA